jgi:hypothetical protein
MGINKKNPGNPRWNPGLRPANVKRTVGQQRRAPGFLRTHPVFLNDFFEVITQAFFVI